MTKKFYSKTLENLTILELLCYGIELGLKKVKSTQTKEEIVRNIIKKKSDFLDDNSTIYYFIKDETKNTLEYVKSPDSTDLYQSKKLQIQQRIPISKIKTELEKENSAEDHSESSLDLSRFTLNGDRIVDRTVANEHDDIDEHAENEFDQKTALVQLMQTLATNSGKEKTFNFRQKIKYEPSHGIEAFIRSVESYAAANEINDQLKWIAIAKSALNASEDGLLLQDALLPAEDSDWELFKNRLLSILGNPPDYYRDFYRSFRRGSQKLGLAMSRLTQAYKRGFLGGQNHLTESDKQHIMHQFIASLDNPLRGLLKAEEKNLTFSTIADRAAELERCFGTGFMPDSAATLMFPEARVQMVENANKEKIQDSVNLKLVQMINQMMTQSAQNHQEMINHLSNGKNTTQQNQNWNRNTNRNVRRNRYTNWNEIQPKLNGHCIYWAKFGSCRNQNRCRYKHETNVPDSVKDAIKDLKSE